MSTTYIVAITSVEAESHLSHGQDMVGGFAIDKAQIEGVTDVAGFISLFHLDLPGSPFAPDRPLDILEIPANPFLQVRHAVGPLDPRAVLGGIVEYPPFTGSGTVKAGGVEADLLWMEPTRASIGTRLLRYYPGQSEPRLLATFEGLARGWRNESSGKHVSMPPSNLLGPVVTRPWGEVPVDVELGMFGTPTSVTMVANVLPEDEPGFVQAESGLYVKTLPYSDDLRIHELHMIGKVNTIPVRVARTLRAEDGQILAFCIALILDMPAVMSLEFQRWAQAIATITVPIEDVHAQMQPVEPPSWDMSEAPAVNLLPPEADDTQRIVSQALMLISAIAPMGWTKAAVLVQTIGHSSVAQGVAIVPTEDGTASPSPLPLVPSALHAYGAWLKQQNIDAEAGAPVSVRLDFDAAANSVDIDLNYLNEPDFADEATAEDWQLELASFPRTPEKTPAWLLRRAEAEETTEA